MIAKELKPAEWAEIVAKSWADPSFRSKLLADPKGTLAAEGFSLPSDLDVSIVETKTETLVLKLPIAPAGGSLTKQDIMNVAPLHADFTNCTKYLEVC